MRNPPTQHGEVELADMASGRIVIRCDDGTFAGVHLAEWNRVRVGMRVSWEHAIGANGSLVSPMGYRIDYDVALWDVTEEEAHHWYQSGGER